MLQIADGAAPTQDKRQVAQSRAPRVSRCPARHLVSHVPTGAGWLHEVKCGGYRTDRSRREEGARLYPPRARLVGSLRFDRDGPSPSRSLASALIDGEVVAFDQEQAAELLHAAGRAQGRRAALFRLRPARRSGRGSDAARQCRAQNGSPRCSQTPKRRSIMPTSRRGRGEAVPLIMSRGYEGVVSKRADALSRHHTHDWLKTKVPGGREFVIINGHLEGDRRGATCNAQALRGGTLRYAGRSQPQPTPIRATAAHKLKPLARKTARPRCRAPHR